MRQEIAFARGNLNAENAAISPQNSIDLNSLLDTGTREYLQHIEQSLINQTDIHEFLDNVYSQIQDKKMLVMTDYDASRILERLLRESSDLQVRQFFTELDYYTLVTHPLASHVCQTMLLLASDMVEREFSYYVDNGVHSMESIILDLCSQLHGKWNELLVHPNASFIVRSMLNLLAGESLATDSSIRSKKSKKYNKKHQTTQESKSRTRVVPASFSALLKKIVDSITKMLDAGQIKELAMHPVANPVLQLLVSIPSSGPKLVKALVQDPEFASTLIVDRIGSHLMERIVTFASPKTFDKLWKRYIQPKFLYYCKDTVANFVMQRVIKQVPSGEILKEILNLIKDDFADMICKLSNLVASRTGIAVAVLEASREFPGCQQTCIDYMLSAFGATEKEAQNDLVHLLIFLRNHDRFTSRLYDPDFNVQGAVMIQHILNFKEGHNSVLANSIALLPKETVFRFIRDQIASRAIDALLDSPTVSKKVKRQIVAHTLGSIADLATDKYASHFLDKAWAVSNVPTREQIAEELMVAQNRLKDNFHGKFVLRNCKIEMFRYEREQWLQLQKDSKKKEKEDKKSKDNAETDAENPKRKRDEIDELFSKKQK